MHKAGLSFSCIVDRPHKIQSAAIRWAHALIEIEKVDPSRIFIQCVEQDLPTLDHFRSLGTKVILTERFGDGKHCNKLIQLDCHDIFESSAIVLFDCDTVCTGRFSDELVRRFQSETARLGDRFAIGKTVDAPNPPIEMFLRLRDHFRIEQEFRLTAGTLEGALTPDGYFNGGLYCLPTSQAGDFGPRWKEWALRLLESTEAKEILGSYFWHVDQISFYFAAIEGGLELETLDSRFNCATHFSWPRIEETSDTPFVIHYHNNLRPDGRIGIAGSRAIDLATNRVNDLLANTQLQLDNRFDLKDLEQFTNWEDIEPTMSITSKNLAQLHAGLRIAGIEQAASVVEYRCASARHLAGLSIAAYRGFDTRKAYLDMASQRLPKLQFVPRALTRAESAELVICLDISGALAIHPSLEALIEDLSLAATQSLLVGGECVRSALLGDDPDTTLDVAGALRRTGEFQFVLPLARHGGRELFLALKPAAVAKLVADGPPGFGRLLDATPDPTSLLITVLTERAARHATPGAALTESVDAASLFEYPSILSLLGHGTPNGRFAVVGKTISPISLALASRGVDFQVFSAEGMASASFEDKTFSTWIIQRNSWQRVEDLNAVLLSNATPSLVPGGTLLLTFDLKKRTNDIISSEGSALSLSTLLGELEGMGYLILDRQIVPLPFNIANDFALIRAIYLGKDVGGDEGGAAQARQMIDQPMPDEPPHRKFRTPKPLRDFERKIRLMIRGAKPND